MSFGFASYGGRFRMVSAIDPTKPRDGVPASKADLRASLGAAKAEIEELQLRKIENGMPFDMDGSRLTGPVLNRYTEVIARATIDGGQLVIDFAWGNIFEIRLTQDVVSLLLLNPPPVNQACSAVLIVAQDENGGRSFAWPESVMWSGGLAPSVSTAPNSQDIYALVTTNGGASWFGFVGGQTFR
jgi:hypothetical protein